MRLIIKLIYLTCYTSASAQVFEDISSITNFRYSGVDSVRVMASIGVLDY